MCLKSEYKHTASVSKFHARSPIVALAAGELP